MLKQRIRTAPGRYLPFTKPAEGREHIEPIFGGYNEDDIKAFADAIAGRRGRGGEEAHRLRFAAYESVRLVVDGTIPVLGAKAYGALIELVGSAFPKVDISKVTIDISRRRKLA